MRTCMCCVEVSRANLDDERFLGFHRRIRLYWLYTVEIALIAASVSSSDGGTSRPEGGVVGGSFGGGGRSLFDLFLFCSLS